MAAKRLAKADYRFDQTSGGEAVIAGESLLAPGIAA
jgi:hypothetical protein